MFIFIKKNILNTQKIEHYFENKNYIKLIIKNIIKINR